MGVTELTDLDFENSLVFMGLGGESNKLLPLIDSAFILENPHLSCAVRIRARWLRFLKMMERIGGEFFKRSPLNCARKLIGCQLVWDKCRVKIDETEAYFAVGDPACHTWSRPSAREFVERHSAGTAYV